MKAIPIASVLSDPEALGGWSPGRFMGGVDRRAQGGVWRGAHQPGALRLRGGRRRSLATGVQGAGAVGDRRAPRRQKPHRRWRSVVYIATCIDHSARLSAGEVGMVLVLAASRAQAAVVFGYIKGFLEASAMLSRQVKSYTTDEIRLKSGIIIAVHPNSFRTIRGRTLLACVFDEVAYWATSQTANPDIETYRAVLPALATTSGVLIAISSPYRKAGLLHAKHRDHFGRDSEGVLVIKGATIAFNPGIDTGAIERARESDPTAALSEWDAEFRQDLSAFLSDELIDGAVDHGRPLELPPREGIVYRVFGDVSAGRSDATAICIGHVEDQIVVIDVVRGRPAPHNPADAITELCARRASTTALKSRRTISAANGRRRRCAMLV